MKKETLHWNNLSSISALAGVIGPAFFFLVMTLAGFLRPGYSAMAEAGSNLGVGHNGWIMNSNFFLSGGLFVISALGFPFYMRGVIKHTGWRILTALLLILPGIELINESFFATDIPGFPPTTIHGELHIIGFFVIFLDLILAPIIIGILLWQTPFWRTYSVYSLITGFLLTPLSIVFLFYTTKHIPQIAGFAERILIGVTFLWYAVTHISRFASLSSSLSLQKKA